MTVRPISGTATTLPYLLVLNCKSIPITGDQLLKFCADNGDLRFEMTANKELIVMPPAGAETGWRENRINVRLGNWSEGNGTGLDFGPSAGFTLPNGAMRAPDASWVLRSRWDAITAEEKRRFAPLCPDFVIEVRSPSDALIWLQEKLEEYIDNGAQLGWLIDPQQHQVHIYRPGQPTEILEEPGSVSGDPLLPGFVLDLTEIW